MAFARKKPVFDPAKPFAWSYSKIKNFEVCPKRHYEVDIVKNYTDDGEALKYGNAVHDALAGAIGNKGNKAPDGRDVKPIPEPHQADLNGWQEPYLAMRARGALVATEMDMAINANFQPTGWFDKDAWYRAKVDVLAISEGGLGKVGLAVDWKTGKPVEDTPQLQMTALVMFAHYQNLELVQARFVWLKFDDKTEEKILRKDSAAVWNQIAPRVVPLHAAYTNPDPVQGFPAKPGFLCRSWCPVKSCQHHGGK